LENTCEIPSGSYLEPLSLYPETTCEILLRRVVEVDPGLRGKRDKRLLQAAPSCSRLL